MGVINNRFCFLQCVVYDIALIHKLSWLYHVISTKMEVDYFAQLVYNRGSWQNMKTSSLAVRFQKGRPLQRIKVQMDTVDMV